ncbi:MAG TPA: class IIb bacteriocin, lactobin A/cerein 7B family [Pseudohongiella sp.]|nr:class IIb bacteriocin, lactobin A/cerein 7B family [Pseudohongiella sp.]
MRELSEKEISEVSGGLVWLATAVKVVSWAAATIAGGVAYHYAAEFASQS